MKSRRTWRWTPAEVIWLIHKGEAEDPLAHFRASGIEGVRGTHNKDHEFTKPETPFWVNTVVTPVGHVEWRFAPCDCCHFWALSKWGVGFMTCHPSLSKYHKYIIVVIKYFIKWLETMHTFTNDGKIITLFILNHAIVRFSVPREIIIDHGTHLKIE